MEMVTVLETLIKIYSTFLQFVLLYTDKLAFLYLKCILVKNENALIVFSKDVLKAGTKIKQTKGS